MNQYQLILNILPSFLLVIALVGFSFWAKKHIKNKVAEQGKTEEFERNKSRNSAVLYPLMGLVYLGIVFFNWQSIPLGNEITAYLFLGLGVAAIIYGLYKWFRLSKEI